jgi:hypothetical protein
MREGFQVQYESLLQNYGRDCAERYRQVIHGQPPQHSTRQRWTSNRIHRPKTFNDLQASVIRSEYSAGYTCRQLAQKWGCSQGSISNIVKERGAYKEKNA